MKSSRIDSLIEVRLLVSLLVLTIFSCSQQESSGDVKSLPTSTTNAPAVLVNPDPETTQTFADGDSKSTVETPAASDTVTETERDKIVELPGGERVVARVERQEFSPVCKAERKWIEVENTSKPDAAETINSRIRREITVGRRLKEEDCPSLDGGEDYLYYNVTELSGVWHRFIGTRTSVYFPGGSGRSAHSCLVIDLQTGKKHKLKKYLLPQTAGELEARLNQAAQEINFPSGYLPLNIKEATFCLKYNGILVAFTNDSAAFSAEVLVIGEEVSRFFELPKALASHAPKKKSE